MLMLTIVLGFNEWGLVLRFKVEIVPFFASISNNMETGRIFVDFWESKYYLSGCQIREVNSKPEL